jgi:hypothetical protein
VSRITQRTRASCSWVEHDEVERWLRRLYDRERRTAKTSPPDHLAKGMHLTCVRDPDGNLIELIGPRPSR